MKKYMFTGHLTPLPPCVKLPLTLSGEVYLPWEVEEELRRKDAAHAKEIAGLNERIRKLTMKAMGFRKRRRTSDRGVAK